MIKVSSLNKIYFQGKMGYHVLKNLNFEIDQGDYVAIMGTSGSGKTTLLNILGLMDEASDGLYLLNGCLVSTLNDREKSLMRNKYIGFIFQSFNLISYKTIYENVVLPLKYDKGKRKGDHLLVAKALDRVGMSDYLNHYPNELSGGQQQRVAIARAIINRPKLLLADEPTGNLDSHTGNEVMDLIDELHKQDQTTIILITHDKEIANRADKILFLRDGVLDVQSKEGDYGVAK